MKKTILTALALTSLNVFSANIVWEGRDNSILNVNTNSFASFKDDKGQNVIVYTCMDKQKLIIKGKVNLTHPKEDITKDEASKVIIKCYDIHFAKNATLYTKSALGLYATNDISGDIQIINNRGVKGSPGANSTHSYLKRAADGGAGSSGSNADDADCFKFSPPGNGKIGQHANHAQHGAVGKPGAKGFSGTNSAKIIVESKSIKPNTTIYISAIGGNGGRGGNGSQGQNGGYGGFGGTGGAGGDGVCPTWLYKGGNGGRGGDGGNGGHGGKGGNGGNGGAGGDGGDIRVWVVNPNKYTQDFHIDIDMFTSGGQGGDGGIGGTGGVKGIGGEGGQGGDGGNSWLVSDGKKGGSGSRGIDGENGEKGSDGQVGPDGEPGVKQLFDLARVAPREDDFYRLPKANQKNMVNSRKQMMDIIRNEKLSDQRLNQYGIDSLM